MCCTFNIFASGMFVKNLPWQNFVLIDKEGRKLMAHGVSMKLLLAREGISNASLKGRESREPLEVFSFVFSPRSKHEKKKNAPRSSGHKADILFDTIPLPMSVA